MTVKLSSCQERTQLSSHLGNKITGYISPHLRFHASKEVAWKYLLASRPRNKWPTERFDTVDWEHLDLLALKNKADMYRIWRSKQHSGFCGTTRVQVGQYSGELSPDERCPNCGDNKKLLPI